MLIENWRQSWKLLTIKLQLAWAALMSAFLASPAETQADLISTLAVFFGWNIEPRSVTQIFVLFAQVNVAYAAATVAARLKAQPGVSQVEQ